MDRDRPRFGLRNLGALAALAAWSWYAAAAGPELGLPGRDLGSLVAGLSRQGLWFVPIGVLVPLALPRMRGLFTGLFLVLLPSLALGAAVSVLVAAAPETAPWRVFETFVAPEPPVLLAPLAGMFAGALFGVVFARGIGSALLVLPALAAIGAVLLAIVAVALLLLTDRVATTEPIGPPAGRWTVGVAGALDAPAFASAFRLALAVAGAPPETRIRLVPDGDALELGASLPWRLPLVGERFWNLAARAQPSVEDGRFRAGVRSLRVGGLRAPPTWVRPASRLASRWLGRTAAVRAFTSRFDAIRVEDSRLLLRRAALRESAQVAEYLDLLAREPGRTRLADALERAFGLAALRSLGGNAVPENRAALLALGGAGGHPAFFGLAGLPPPGATRPPLVATLKGRRDWARHFLLSAGLTQLAPDGIPEAAGLLKERLDARRGRFSFADLLMDGAGTRFGEAATRDEAAARRMQARLAAGITDDDLAPPDEGLPEGVSLARLEAEFGGVRGEGFRELEAEIARRLDGLPLYRRVEIRAAGLGSDMLPGNPRERGRAQ